MKPKARVIYVEYSHQNPDGKLVRDQYDKIKEDLFGSFKHAREHVVAFNERFGDTINVEPFTRAYHAGWS